MFGISDCWQSPRRCAGAFYKGMLHNRPQTQSSLEFVGISELVPADHLLHKIEQAIDFSFIHEQVEDFYCQDNGRPELDFLQMFKQLGVAPPQQTGN